MKRIISLILTLILYLFSFAGCDKSENNNNLIEPTYERITAVQAKKLMDSEKDYIILDVRTEEEFNEGHIEEAILIPDYEISEKAETMLPDKDQLILVYCRSGRRSKEAADKMVKLGYTNIVEFGGIIDYTGEIEK